MQSMEIQLCVDLTIIALIMTAADNTQILFGIFRENKA